MKNLLSKTLVALLLFTGLSSSLLAAGNLMVTPTRVVFEPRDRSAQVTLINQSDKTSTYRISFLRQNMTESGEFVAVEEGQPGLFSDPMIRFSPRQIRLPPGQSQVVRLALRRPADMVAGEYRSHMLFQALPEPSSSNVEALTQQAPEGIAIELVPIVGISIPVIVRHGDLNSSVKFSDASIVPADQSGSAAKISVVINRDGNSSAYGDLRAIFTPEGAAPVVIAQVNGVAVYANMQSRSLELPLNLPADLKLEKGEVELVFLKPGADEKSGTLAQTILFLN